MGLGFQIYSENLKASMNQSALEFGKAGTVPKSLVGRVGIQID
jgi:hypothetical protein